MALRREKVDVRRCALHAAAAGRAGQGAAADHPSAAHRPPDLPGRGRPAQPAPRRRGGRRLARHLLRRPSTRPTSSPRCAPGARPVGAGEPGDPMAGLRRRGLGAGGRHRRPRGGPRGAGRLHRAVHRRHGQPRAELLQRARPTDGLRGRRRDDPGPLPRRPGARRGGRRAVRAHRRHRPDRAAGADRRADRPVRRRRGDHAERRAARVDHRGPCRQVLRSVAEALRLADLAGRAPRLSARARRTHLRPGHHPRDRRGTHRVPPDQLHRPPHDHRAAARAAGRRPGDHRLHRHHPDRRDRRDLHLLRRARSPACSGRGRAA